MKPASSSKKIIGLWCAASATCLVALCLLLDHKDQSIAWRTLILGGMASLIALPIGVLLAWVSAGRGFWAAAVRWFCIVGVLLPVFVHVTAWDAAFGKLGLLTNTFGSVLTPIVARWPAAVWIHSMIAAPQIAILFLVAMRSGTENWEDALRLEAPAFTANLRIVVWRFMPVAVAGVLWTMISCAREIGVTDIYQIGTLSEQVYLGYSLGQLNAIGAAWTPEQLADAQNLGTGITVLTIALLSASAMFAFVSMSRCLGRSESQRPAVRKPVGRLLQVVGFFLMVVVVVVPIVNLIGRVGFAVARVDGQPVATWDFRSAMTAISGVFTNFQDEFTWSFLIAAASASLVVCIAMPLVWFCRKSLVGMVFVAALFGIFASIPGPSLGLFVGKLFGWIELSAVQYLFDRTIAAPVMANVLFCLPLALPIFWFLSSQVSIDQQEYAKLEGVSSWRQFVQFVFLGQWQANLGAWFLIAAFSFAELSATQMVLPPGMDTVPRLALGMLHAGVNESTAALTLVTLLPVVVLGALSQICFAASSRNGLQ